jgi:hypothetical protein
VRRGSRGAPITDTDALTPADALVVVDQVAERLANRLCAETLDGYPSLTD